MATAEYWDKLQRWMSRVLPAQLDEVIIGGGAAYHVEPELEKYFNCEPKIETQSSLSRHSYGSGGTKIRTSGYKSKNYNKHFTLAMSVERPQFVLPNYVAPQLTPPDLVPADARANNRNTILQSNILESAQLIERPNTLIQGKTSSKDLDNLFGDD